jgi:uncharacterized protein (TIGR03790 family)
MLTGLQAFAAEPSIPPVVQLPRQALTADQLAVVVNDLDPLSQRIGAYYMERRGIPAANRIRVRFTPDRSRMDVAEFQALYRQVQSATPEGVQAYALTWAAPYRVDCMSITTAFAAGYDPTFCASPCALTRASPLFGTNIQNPYTDSGWRPTMALAGTSFEAVKALIDRGIAADDTRPPGPLISSRPAIRRAACVHCRSGSCRRCSAGRCGSNGSRRTR